jgi:hypothetical protein
MKNLTDKTAILLLKNADTFNVSKSTEKGLEIFYLSSRHDVSNPETLGRSAAL